MKLSLIVALSSNGVIGYQGQMPWHLSADLKRFKKLTTGFPIIMGRKTFESIGKPLAGRTNIVISKTKDYQTPGCLVYGTLEQALNAACNLANEAFVIGGAGLYAATLAQANKLYITHIHQAFVGDTFFPRWEPAEWLEINREDINDDPQTNFRYSFVTYQRLDSSP
jgi:dihydrofolate reductase